ncbi:hypothetical protein WT67_08260 [Burkholderia stagnalis]|uniref:Uncharacterized protein n=1 Tax=Burkholderia stagnalis TaxID=1503054 RepID=A0A6L3MVL8_9BURK|nr:hypothetical protein [Burkholderia stagnalis]KAB0636147.1 hypothetical protein F7R25_20945 [Burkholderia stagnalis]KVD82561.1 hypothetical protein WS63_30345 [Burkholderia stagnalis]KVO52566.1 hypothetical protein WT17_31065 [Burkholderia stagnalis]KVO77555.1 hypothetical protein WT19_08255 [Burkholderia stagnalis]KVW68876.1 hypothetical protein WT28_03125 [Burkholderia stagnalis]
MTTRTPRFLIENVGPDKAKVGFALSEAATYCNEHHIEHLVLAVSSKGTFPQGIVAETLGSTAVKALQAGNSVTLGNTGVKMTLVYPAVFSGAPSDALFLAMHLTLPDIEKIDDLPSTAAIVFVPWLEGHGKEWLSTWQPTTWGTSTWHATPSTMAPEVTAALSRLQSSINVATGLLHSADKKAATATFKALRSGGHTIDPDEIKRWAWRSGWGQRGVNDLVAVAHKYQG